MKRTIRGFTLVELMVCMGIIAILMGLLFPAVQAMREMAKRTRAKAEIRQIETCWRCFLSDYRSWNGFMNAPGRMDMTAVNILRASNTTYNPRNVSYMEFGLNSYDTRGMKDPWTNIYYLALDIGYSNTVRVTTPSNMVIMRPVAVWSKGAKNGLGGSRDDVNDDVRGWE